MATSAPSPFFWGGDGERLTPDAIKRRRAIAEAMVKGGADYSPIQHWSQGLNRVAQALLGGYESGQLDRAESGNAKSSQANIASMLGALTGSPDAPAPGARPAGLVTPSAPSAGGAPIAVTPNSGAAPAAAPVLQPGQIPGSAPVVPSDGFVKAAAVEAAPAAGGEREDVAALKGALGPMESGNRYDIKGPFNKKYGFPLGKYQVMESNLPQWSQAAVGRVVSPEEFLKSADLQEQIAGHRMGLIIDKYGSLSDAASVWHSGRPLAQAKAAGARDVNMSTADYVAKTVGRMRGNLPARTAGAVVDDPNVPSSGPGVPLAYNAPSAPADLPAQGASMADLPAQGARPAGFFVPPAVSGGEPTIIPTPDDVAPGAQPVAQQAQAPARVRVAQALSPDVVQTLADPYASDAEKQIAGMLLQKHMDANKPVNHEVKVIGDQAYSFNPRTNQLTPLPTPKNVKPMEVKGRLIDGNTGRVIYEPPKGSGSNEYSKSPVYGVGPDGKPVILQLGDGGDAVQTRMPNGVTLARDPIKVDGPSGTTLLDPQTRQIVGFIPKDNKTAESDKVVGKSEGEAKVGLTGAIAKSEQTLSTIEAIRSHPGRDSWGAQGATANLPIIRDGLPGTKGRDFVGLVEQLKGKSFLEAFESLKGGGAVSEVEGAKATAAIARLDRAQSREGFDAALKDLEDVIRSGMGRAREKAGAGAPKGPSLDDLLKKYGGGR